MNSICLRLQKSRMPLIMVHTCGPYLRWEVYVIFSNVRILEDERSVQLPAVCVGSNTKIYFSLCSLQSGSEPCRTGCYERCTICAQNKSRFCIKSYLPFNQAQSWLAVSRVLLNQEKAGSKLNTYYDIFNLFKDMKSIS